MEEYIQRRKEDDFGFSRTNLPGRDERGATLPVWLSAGALGEEGGPLLLLIQGSGAVRPGQWARSLCINAALDDGACLRTLRSAAGRGWEVAVLNPNHPGGGGPRAHAGGVWDSVLRHTGWRS